jgi:MoaA/NifB/PqqE/SkfB family radical SAM enzyme
MLAYARNLLKLARGQRNLHPRLAMYYVTTHCNLNCAYCEDFGARRNEAASAPPGLDAAQKILRVIRGGIPRLWLTGGEPLLVPYLPELLEYARDALKFREISIITNGMLLSQRLEILPRLDRLVVSLDSSDPDALAAVNLPLSYAEAVIAAVQQAARLQSKYQFQLVVNAVITPETLPGLDSLLEFCIREKIRLSFSPQSFNNWPRYELLAAPEYRAFLKRVIAAKRRGAPIVGSLAYLKTLLEQTPYDCYPTLTPRILPDGWLVYPCRPLEKAGAEQGGRAVNLLEVETWEQAWDAAQIRYGDPPSACQSCFQQCYAEPSLMQSRPLEMLAERLLYSRGLDLTTYAPG